MKLKRNVVMLPTNERAVEQGQLVVGAGNYLFASRKSSDIGTLKAQHLYITSDEEIKEGDWCIQNGNYLCKITCNQDRTQQGLKKIIATTDKSLGLPSLSNGFIKKFIERYNAGTGLSRYDMSNDDNIKDVLHSVYKAGLKRGKNKTFKTKQP